MADPLDILTLNEAKSAINLAATNTAHDTELAQFVTAVSRRVDDLCGPVVVRTITGELHDGAGSIILLKQWPVSSVTTIAEWASGTSTALTVETLAAATANDYTVDTSIGAVTRRSSWSTRTFAAGQANVVVTYVAGRYANTAGVDPKFKLAAASVLRRLWKREAGAWAQTPDSLFSEEGVGLAFFNAVDKVVDELLGDERKAPAVA